MTTDPQPRNTSRFFRMPPETLAEAELAIEAITHIIENIERDLSAAEANPRLRGGRVEHAAWSARARDALKAHREQIVLFRYYREVLRVPRSYATTTRHLNTSLMRDPVTLAEAEAGVLALEQALACTAAVEASVRERGDTSEAAKEAVERASVAARHYREKLPAARVALERMRANGPGPVALLEAFAEVLPEALCTLPVVRDAIGVLRAAIVTDTNAEGREAA